MTPFNDPLSKLLNGSLDKTISNEQSVIICFQYGIESLDPIFELQDELDAILKQKGVGYCDGHEIAMDMTDGSFYLYGRNAEEVFKTIEDKLRTIPFLQGALVSLTFGHSEDGV